MSRIDERKMLSQQTKYSWYRHRDIEFGQYFTKNYQVVYCSYIDGFVKAMGIDYCISDWRLFMIHQIKVSKQLYYSIETKSLQFLQVIQLVCRKIIII